MKTIAARPRDWLDIEAVIIKQANLDWDYILNTIQSLDAYEDVAARISRLEDLKSTFYQK